MLDIVSIVGRPNVGKSTLFNRLISHRRALVNETPGTTIDYIESDAEWNGKRFTLIDTGGWLPKATDNIHIKMNKILRYLVEKSSVIIFVVDAKSGITPADEELGEYLRKFGKNVIVAVNKVDSQKRESHSAEFFKFGFEKLFGVSALGGRNIDFLLDALVEKIKKKHKTATEETKIIILGRPNAGKSTLLNKLISQERTIVDENPGTTRESVNVNFKCGVRNYLITDTPGITRKRKYDSFLDYLSYLSMSKSVKYADAAVLLIDAVFGITKADESLAGLIKESGIGCLVAMNKWDLVEEKGKKFEELKEQFVRRFNFLNWAEFTTISAKSGLRMNSVFEKLGSVCYAYNYALDEKKLMEVLHRAFSEKSLVKKGRKFLLKGIKKILTRPPGVEILVSNPEILDFSHERYLINEIRANFPLRGTPLKLYFQRSK